METIASPLCMFFDTRASCTINCFMMNIGMPKIAQPERNRQLDLKYAKSWFNMTF